MASRCKSKASLASAASSAASSAAATAASASAWDTMYDELVQFHQKHGHCRIPHHNQNLRKLYKWASRQRVNAALSEQQRARLDAVGFDWTAQDQNRDSRWNEMVERLEAYKDKHGDCLVSASCEDQQLVDWVKKQRYFYWWEKAPDERVRRLESLGFDWDPGRVPRVGDEGGGRRRGSPPATPAGGQTTWDGMYEKLARSYRTNGDCYVSRSADAYLRAWILEQRVANANNELSADKRLKLDRIHFPWMSQDEKYEEAWNKMFEYLKAHKATNGDCLVPKLYQGDPKLVKWVERQRYAKKEGKLLRHRRDRLKSIGFCWNASKASDRTAQSPRRDPAPAQHIIPAPAAAAGEQTSWDVMYEKLARYYEIKGNCYVSKLASADLRGWMLEQRVANANNELSADKRLKLEQIHFQWMGQDEKHEEFWSKMFENLKTYKAANGDCLVPRSSNEDLKLYMWVIRQRDANRTGKLPRHRRDRLQGIGFCWDTSKASDDASQSQRSGPAPAFDDVSQSQRRHPAPAQDIALAPVAPAGEQSSWDAMYEKLVRSYEIKGNCFVSKLESADLRSWMLEQRVANANNELSADKRLKLEQIHFAWMGQEEQQEDYWNDMFESLKAYKAANGDCLVPKSYCDDLKLHNWVKWQRFRNNIGKLPWHRRDRLQGIGFCWDVSLKPKGRKRAPSLAAAQTDVSSGDPTSVSLSSSNGQQPPPRWNLQLERLKIYQAWYGDCLVPTSYDKELAEWVSWQHHLHKINKLREPRYGKLERIGFFSDAEAEQSLNGGTRRGVSMRDPQESEAQSIAGAQDLLDGTNDVGNLSRSPKRARV